MKSTPLPPCPFHALQSPLRTWTAVHTRSSMLISLSSARRIFFPLRNSLFLLFRLFAGFRAFLFSLIFPVFFISYPLNGSVTVNLLPLSSSTFHRDFSIHLGNNILGNRHSQPSTRYVPRSEPGFSLIRNKDLVQEFLRHTGTCIFHNNLIFCIF